MPSSTSQWRPDVSVERERVHAEKRELQQRRSVTGLPPAHIKLRKGALGVQHSASAPTLLNVQQIVAPPQFLSKVPDEEQKRRQRQRQ